MGKDRKKMTGWLSCRGTVVAGDDSKMDFVESRDSQYLSVEGYHSKVG